MSTNENRFTGDLDRSLALLAEDVMFPDTPRFDSAFAMLSDQAVTWNGDHPSTLQDTAGKHGLPHPIGAETSSATLRSRGSGRVPRSGTARWVAVAAAALLVATLALPVTRDALATWFDIPGIRIEFGDEPGDPGPTVTTIGGSLLLGEETTLAEARDQVGLPRLIPGGRLAGIVPEVYRTSYQGVPVVSLLYPASAGLPEIGTTGVGLLLMAIDDDGSSVVPIAKRATGETWPLTVMVNGQEGFWIEGGVLTVDAGDPFWTYERRSGNVLIWRQDGITYRMECALPLADALALAESLVAVPD
jgi:hypothetical protein